MEKIIKKRIDEKLSIAVAVAVFLLAIVTIFQNYNDFKSELSNAFSYFPFINKIRPAVSGPTILNDIKKFASEREFRAYLEQSKIAADVSVGIGGAFYRPAVVPLSLDQKNAMEGDTGGSAAPDRVSQTTVQVAGVDEPDIVKTDGKEIYFSPSQIFRIWERPVMMDVKIAPPYYQNVETKIIKAFPPANLAEESKLKGKSGDLLLSNGVLIVFSAADNEIYGYDVSSPKSPKEKWKVKLENNTAVVGARLYNGKVYLVTRENINEKTPCPIKPLTLDDTPLVIDCGEIYHPVNPVPVDVAFSAMVLIPESGKIEKNVSFVGSSGASVVYMSENSIYVTYNYTGSVIKFYADFFKEKGRDLIPVSLLQKIEKLESYDISQQSKIYEFQFILGQHLNSLNADERLKFENELNNRLADYFKIHKRDLEKTGIVKIKVDGEFEISASGNVPGFPLNQFALDEYRDNLRIAVTVGDRFGGGGFGFGMSRGESANDVYVLDKDLKISGQVLDLGLTERIYSVRFIGDEGYVVTFRQTDPFYVLDLKNPRDPKLAGELKIPGFSSYLHPLDETHILGVGQEGSQVKISLFDVSDKSKPVELDKYLLNEYWTEVSSNYHAFLLDSKHKIFFLPGANGGYVFSYAKPSGNILVKCTPDFDCRKFDYKFELEKAISQITAKRAIYIDDYLYVIGEDKITVLNELNWNTVKELGLASPVE